MAKAAGFPEMMTMATRFSTASVRARPRVALIGTLAGLLLASPAAADVIVISSSDPALKSGAVLRDSATIEIGSGRRARVMLPSGRTQELSGPTRIKVSSLGQGEKINESLWNDVKRLVARHKSADESVVGAVRSVAPGTVGKSARGGSTGAAGAAPRFSWRHVPIDKGGDVCIEKGATVELQRAKSGAPVTVTVVEMRGRKRATSEFAAGSATAPWPAELRSDVGIYMVSVPQSELREIRLRPIAPLPHADETLRVLHSQRCLVQVEAWLAGHLTASR